jgi:hypothetical protein
VKSPEEDPVLLSGTYAMEGKKHIYKFKKNINSIKFVHNGLGFRLRLGLSLGLRFELRIGLRLGLGLGLDLVLSLGLN